MKTLKWKHAVSPKFMMLEDDMLLTSDFLKS